MGLTAAESELFESTDYLTITKTTNYNVMLSTQGRNGSRSYATDLVSNNIIVQDMDRNNPPTPSWVDELITMALTPFEEENNNYKNFNYLKRHIHTFYRSIPDLVGINEKCSKDALHDLIPLSSHRLTKPKPDIEEMDYITSSSFRQINIQ